MKIDKYGVYNLDEQAILKIIDLAPPQRYQIRTNLYYEGQTPIVAYLIIDGQAALLKNKKIITNLSRGSLIGLDELMGGLHAKHHAVVSPNTGVSYLDRSTLLEIINHHVDDDLATLFKNAVETKAS